MFTTDGALPDTFTHKGQTYTRDADSIGFRLANGPVDPRLQRLHAEAKTRAAAYRAKTARTFRGDLTNEKLGWPAAVYTPASDFRAETVDDRIFVVPIGAPSMVKAMRPQGGWPEDHYAASIEGDALVIRTRQTAAAIANWASGGTDDRFKVRDAAHESLWQRFNAARGRAA